MVLPIKSLPFDENSCGAMGFYKNEIKSDLFSENLNQINSHQHEDNSKSIPVRPTTYESHISQSCYYGYSAALQNVEQTTMHNKNNNNNTSSIACNVFPPVEMVENYNYIIARKRLMQFEAFPQLNKRQRTDDFETHMECDDDLESNQQMKIDLHSAVSPATENAFNGNDKVEENNMIFSKEIVKLNVKMVEEKDVRITLKNTNYINNSNNNVSINLPSLNGSCILNNLRKITGFNEKKLEEIEELFYNTHGASLSNFLSEINN